MPSRRGMRATELTTTITAITRPQQSPKIWTYNSIQSNSNTNNTNSINNNHVIHNSISKTGAVLVKRKTTNKLNIIFVFLLLLLSSCLFIINLIDTIQDPYNNNGKNKNKSKSELDDNEDEPSLFPAIALCGSSSFTPHTNHSFLEYECYFTNYDKRRSGGRDNGHTTNSTSTHQNDADKPIECKSKLVNKLSELTRQIGIDATHQTNVNGSVMSTSTYDINTLVPPCIIFNAEPKQKEDPFTFLGFTSKGGFYDTTNSSNNKTTNPINNNENDTNGTLNGLFDLKTSNMLTYQVILSEDGRFDGTDGTSSSSQQSTIVPATGYVGYRFNKVVYDTYHQFVITKIAQSEGGSMLELEFGSDISGVQYIKKVSPWNMLYLLIGALAGIFAYAGVLYWHFCRNNQK